MESSSFDLTVIGAGPGGYVAAIRAAQSGKSVAIVERELLGGVCLNWGCIPTKALLKIAENYEFLKESADWGFDIGEVKFRWDRIVERSRMAADRLSRGVDFLMNKHNVQVFYGTGRFLSANRIAVDSAEGGVTELQTTHTIIATGARPSTLPGVELDGERIFASKEAMVLPEVPRSMTIIGAGAVGLEFAYFYAVFGCEVTLVEYLPRILPGGDPEVSQALERAFKKQGMKIYTSSRVQRVGIENRKVRTTVEQDGSCRELESDAALVAVGVSGNIEGLGLEDIGVETQRGFIPVDGYCQTNVPAIYAIGDVCGPPALAHAASAEGLQAVRHMYGKDPEPIDYKNIPSCVYCLPQVASVGMTEPEAKEAGFEVQIGRFPFTANGKAVAVGDTTGFVKIIADKKYGEILGAHILGPEATELIGELTLAKTAELSASDVHHAIHAHPTLSESIMEAAADWSGESTAI